jgi:hypothetical protein
LGGGGGGIVHMVGGETMELRMKNKGLAYCLATTIRYIKVESAEF